MRKLAGQPAVPLIRISSVYNSELQFIMNKIYTAL
jgi:hypothetical protein